MPYFLITLALQAVFAVHCIRTGRNTIWIWVIVLLPLAGVIAYIIAEILPELFGSRTARRAAPPTSPAASVMRTNCCARTALRKRPPSTSSC